MVSEKPLQKLTHQELFVHCTKVVLSSVIYTNVLVLKEKVCLTKVSFVGR